MGSALPVNDRVTLSTVVDSLSPQYLQLVGVLNRGTDQHRVEEVAIRPVAELVDQMREMTGGLLQLPCRFLCLDVLP